MKNSKEILDEEIQVPWPQKGDILVSDSNADGNLAQTMYHDGWEPYVFAYRKAAEFLVEQVSQERLWGNLLIFPIAFVYRHYFELRLKTLIHDGCELERIPATTGDEHRLLPLWRRCRPIVEKWLTTIPKSELDAVEETLTQFENLDPNGQMARYPTNNTGENPSNLLGIKINVKNFAETITKSANLLDAVADEFSELKSNCFY